MKKPQQLSPGAIEQLASQYRSYDQAIKSAALAREAIREELLAQVEHYGAAAPKADKTFRLETESYTVDVAKGDKISIDDDAVEKFKARCSSVDERRAFHLIFEMRRYFVKLGGAEIVVSRLRAPLRNLFTKCYSIEPTSPRLSVKEKKEK